MTVDASNVARLNVLLKFITARHRPCIPIPLRDPA